MARLASNKTPQTPAAIFFIAPPRHIVPCRLPSRGDMNSIRSITSVRFSVPPAFLKKRFFWRRRAPSSPDETRRIERWLATARVLLAISAIMSVLLDPTEILHSIWAAGLLAFYVALSFWILVLLRRRQQSTESFRLFVHAGDVVLPALISAFTRGQGNAFFLLFVFVLAEAAYRWGLWETV